MPSHSFTGDTEITTNVSGSDMNINESDMNTNGSDESIAAKVGIARTTDMRVGVIGDEHVNENSVSEV